MDIISPFENFFNKNFRHPTEPRQSACFSNPRPIPEHHRHAAIRAHRHRVHHRAPQPLVELRHWLLLRLERSDEPSQPLALG